MPCPYLRCAHGARGHLIVIGKRKKTVYVRVRNKTEWGPVYDWEKTDLDPEDVTLPPAAPDRSTEETDIVF